jgi:hypothetical protein
MKKIILFLFVFVFPFLTFSQSEIDNGYDLIFSSDSNEGIYPLHEVNFPIVLNSDSENFDLPNKWNVLPGDLLKYSVIIEGIELKSSIKQGGAGILLRCFDKNNKLIKESKPFPISGTFLPQPISGNFKVPEEGAYIKLTLYKSKETKGTAKFYNVKLFERQNDVTKISLSFPNYRGLVLDSNLSKPWSFDIDSYKQSSIPVKVELFSNNGVLLDRKYIKQSETKFEYYPPSYLENGKYELSISLLKARKLTFFSKREVVIKNRKFPIHIKKIMPNLYFDPNGFLVKNEIRVFPIGIYTGVGPGVGNWASEDEHLERISKAGFNTVLSYVYGNRMIDVDDYMSAAKTHDLDVIFSLKDIYSLNMNYLQQKSYVNSIVEDLKDYENLLAWYINDELDLEAVSVVNDMYKQLIEIDPNHPIYQVNDKVDILDYYDGTYDVIGSDPYPVPQKSKSLYKVTSMTNKTVKSAGTKPVWQVLQLHNLSFHSKQIENRPPSFQEMKNMSHQAIIGGAKGLMFFAYHWLWYGFDEQNNKIMSSDNFHKRWDDISKLVESVNEIIPLIIENEVVDISTELNNLSVVYKCWRGENENYLILANMHARENDLILKDSSIEKLFSNNSKITFEKIEGENKVRILLPSLECGIITIKN